MKEINNNVPFVMLDTCFIIKCCMGVDLTNAEKNFLKLVEKGAVNVIVSPINYGELKYNEMLSYILEDDILKNTFFNKETKTGQLLVFNRAEIFDGRGYFSNLLGLANAYSYDKNRQKRIPYYEFNDRLIAALSRILNIPLITSDGHLLEKGRREHIKKANKRFGYDGFFSYPISIEEFLQNFEHFAGNENFERNQDFRLVPLTNLGAKQSSAYRSTEQLVGGYREKIDNSVYEQLNEILFNEMLNEDNPESLVSLEKRLTKCFESSAEFKSDEDRFQKAKIASTSYMFTLTAISFFIMEYVSQVKFSQGGQEKIDIARLKDIERSLNEFGFSFVYDAGDLVSVDYGGLSFSLCKKGDYKKFYPVHDILGEKLNDNYKINCAIDIDKLNNATSMALIPFGALKGASRTDISKRFAWAERDKKDGIDVISNDLLSAMVIDASVGKISETDLEKHRNDVVKTNICKALMYLNGIEVKDKGSFSFT